MLEEIQENLYRLEIPLPKNPLKYLNVYVIKSPRRNLLVDTGFNNDQCSTALRQGLDEIGVDLKRTDFFITHMHTDHAGLVGVLADEQSLVYCGQPDGDMVTAGVDWDLLQRFTMSSGFPAQGMVEAFERHPGYGFSGGDDFKVSDVKDGSILEYGDYSFTCIRTPGHTEGHMTLYERDAKIYISGDHLLDQITPNISRWQDNQDPLTDYLNSLDKIYHLDIDTVLPGHRNIFHNHRRRIDQLKAHHQRRFDEIRQILSKQADLTAYQVAAQMHWDMTYDYWEQFPLNHRWFATSEANAHLKCLQTKGELATRMHQGVWVWCLK